MMFLGQVQVIKQQEVTIYDRAICLNRPGYTTHRTETPNDIRGFLDLSHSYEMTSEL
jgi:hypothetical protein